MTIEFAAGSSTIDPGYDGRLRKIAALVNADPTLRVRIALEVEIQKVSQVAGPVAVRDALKRVESGYDYVICDCGPSLGAATYNALAAGPILVPVETTRLTVSVLARLTKV